MDFTSSGQEEHEDVCVLFDDVPLVNAASLVEWNADLVQAFVCPSCGYTRCNPGGWLAFRRAGSFVLAMPAFAEMALSDWAFTEFQPPAHLGLSDFPVFSEQSFNRLREVIPKLPPIDQVTQIRGFEAARMCQFSAPRSALGTFPFPITLSTADVLATDPLSVREASAMLEGLIAAILPAASAQLVTPGECQVPLTFYFDQPGFEEWVPLFSTPPALHVGESLLLIPSTAA